MSDMSSKMRHLSRLPTANHVTILPRRWQTCIDDLQISCYNH